MTSTRRRTPFSHSEDSDDPDYLDEQEQEEVIETLQSNNDASNDLYKRAFVCLPLVSAGYFAIHVLLATSRRQVFDALASLASVLSSAYILQYIPHRQPQSDQNGRGPNADGHAGPVDRYLVLLNAVLAGVLGFSAFLAWSRGRLDLAVRNILPLAMLGLVMLVRRQLVGLDVSDLHRLRYNYKGA